jgi:hypothetical protein
MKAPNDSVRAGLTGTLRLIMLTSCVALCGPASQAIAQLKDSTPPPVSGRRLSSPDTIMPADVLARVELIRENIELLRLFLGKPQRSAPLFHVTSAQPYEVHSQARYLQLRTNRLAFEQVRVVREQSIPRADETQPADVFAVIDSALAAVLLVKQSVGIETAVAEKPRPESTTPSEVFNATVAAGIEVNNLLDERASPSDVFQFITGAVHTAATLHAMIPDGPPFPEEPAFEPNKMPSEVYVRMQHCLGLIRELSGYHGLSMLEFAVTERGVAGATPNDVGDLAVLIVEELARIQQRIPDARTPISAHYPGRRYPAHVFQRVGLLERILGDLVDAFGSGVASPGTSTSGSHRG